MDGVKMQQILAEKSEEMINWVVLERNIHASSILRILYMRLHCTVIWIVELCPKKISRIAFLGKSI
jgi:hypothetical protein